MRRTRRPAAVLAAAATTCALMALPAAAAEPITVAFDYTGAAQAVTVPAGMTRATFVLRGGAGGDNNPLFALGGIAAELRATLPVAPGETLELNVGGRGLSGANAGFNGGGRGAGVGPGHQSGAGGGATDVRAPGGGLSTRLLVAAGGGGAGTNNGGKLAGSGGAADADGQDGYSSELATGGGGGLTSGAGGSAGTGPSPGIPGRAGMPGIGADGLASNSGGNSGGGGGGWTGGGSGGLGGVAPGDFTSGGGGGGAGGVSWSAPQALRVVLALASQTGDGGATITFSSGEPTPTTAPTISGAAQVGRTLTCDPGSWAEADRVELAWLRDGAPIADATAAAHEVVADDAGHQLVCRVTASNARGSATATSNAIDVLAYVPLSPLDAPRVTGERRVGGTLTCDPGRWSGAALFSYRWLRDGEQLAGATAATRVATRSDAGRSLQCELTATAGSAVAVAYTAAVGGPARLLLPAPSALVSRAGTAAVALTCAGPTDCRIPRLTIGGAVLARDRVVRAGSSATVRPRLSKALRRRLAARGSALTARVVATPNGGYGGNARVRLFAPRGVR
ncbi:glycine-rich protein [Conexibacter sp. JD483]|uniref:glycine-rich protein n=1 Tax=unclassified Conexibacter TaxID=2627773 RepID=UPI00271BD009|nr:MULTISPECIES: glycine-rich protein [unclassified Conexibacter]MDO8188992.1 glycine-rich protein [Conexibacter sp. CPCC 205706]MDO8201796.1 glycine-rich protein [Conexibacter sp. CPCC 205762]MDR9371515.1 glycine-rich protein [Conexibacter sp. JD483]